MGKRIKNLGLIFGIMSLIYFIVHWQQKCIIRWKRQADKNKALFLVMKQWLNIKQKGKKMESFFLKNNYKRIAIYGMGDIGQCMVKELKGSAVKIEYGIDRNAENICSDIRVLTMNERFPDVDVFVITVVGEFDDISEALHKKIDCPTIAIEDIVNEI